jgi:hypothetical protein
MHRICLHSNHFERNGQAIPHTMQVVLGIQLELKGLKVDRVNCKRV